MDRFREHRISELELIREARTARRGEKTQERADPGKLSQPAGTVAYTNISADGQARQHNGDVYSQNTYNGLLLKRRRSDENLAEIHDRADQEEPVQAKESFIFHGQSATGYARQHVGNVYTNYAYNYTIQKRKSDETLREDQRNKQLLKAAAAGHTLRIEHLLKLGVDIDFSDDDSGFTALHHAALSGFEDTVEALLNAGADVEAQSFDHGTALHLAALKGRANVVKLLLRFRADGNAESNLIGSPLHCACASGDLATASELLRNNVAVDKVALVDFRVVYPDRDQSDKRLSTYQCQPLYLATYSGSPDVLTSMLNAGAMIDEPALVDDTALRDPTALEPTFSGEKPLPEAPPMETQSRYHTPLWVSVQQNLPEVTRLFLERGCSLSAIGSALCEAASLGSNECLKHLLQYSPFPDFAGDEPNGGSPLIGAARFGRIEAARILIEAGALIDPSPNSNALRVAIIHERPEMVTKLLDCGADPTLVRRNGCDTLEFARRCQRELPQSKKARTICEVLEKRALSSANFERLPKV